MFLQTLAHALVVFSVTVFRASIVISERFQAFIVQGVASSAAVKQVQTQIRALVFWFPLEHDG